MMKKIVKLQEDNQGFTLVELMIVVAIIGILAAIAIPQFAQYRIRGFNTSALSDCKNAVTSQTALASDWQRLGSSQFTVGAAYAPAAGPNTGVEVLGGDADGDGLTTIDSNNTERGTAVSVGNGITLFVITDTAPLQLAPPGTYQAVTKHLSGDTVYANDAESSNVYQNVALIAPATAVTIALFQADIANNQALVDDIAAVGGDWVAK